MLPGMCSIGGRAVSLTAPSINPVNISDDTASKDAPGAATAVASVTFGTDRRVRDQDSVILQTWLASGYSSSNYQIQATKLSGSAPTGTLGSWLSLSANRTWSISETGGVAGTTTCKLKIEIRDAALPNTIRDTATFTITADSLAVSGADWANISATGASGSITGSNANQTMSAVGTLNFSTTFAGTYAVFKNGLSQGQLPSMAVAIGDVVHFSATATPASGASVTGTFNVSGLVTDSFTITIRNTSSVDWASIFASSASNSITGLNADQSIPVSGTLNFSTDFTGTYRVFKNGVTQGQIASMAVVAGDTVHFSASDTVSNGDISSGTMFVTGVVTDSFGIFLTNTNSA
jgi:hypothetical protein